STNRITVDRAVVVQSVNGPAATTIVGARSTNSAPSGIRCAFLTTNAALIGFTLTNGCARTNGNAITEQSGGGVWCEVTSARIHNCVIPGNSAADWGGGVFRGTLISCLLTNTTASYGGGAASNILVICTLFTNTAAYNNNNNFGGGAYYSTLTGCVLI